MEYINPEYIENGNIVSKDYKNVKANSKEEMECFCELCWAVYKKRPMICRCRSNVFLRDINDKKNISQENNIELRMRLNNVWPYINSKVF